MIRSPLLLLWCALALALALPDPARAQNASPPHSNAFGKSLEEWMELYWRWAIGGESDGQVKNVRFLPLPANDVAGGSNTAEDPLILVGEIDVTLKPGQAFALPLAAFIGESYLPELNLPDDPPQDASNFTEADILVEIDGRTVLDSSVDDLSDYYWGPIFFDPPLVYPVPTSYGSIATLFAQGVGIVHPPLSKGEHTLTVVAEVSIPDFGFFFEYHNTWNITVGK